MREVEPLLAHRADTLLYYSPYHFIKGIRSDLQYHQLIRDRVKDFTGKAHHLVIEVEIDQYIHLFYIRYLPWDSAYFQIPTYKIFIVLYQHTHHQILDRAVTAFRNSFMAKQNIHCFFEIPSEDIVLMQSFTQAGFKLVETRLNYYIDTLEFVTEERFSVRKAVEGDNLYLKKVAAEARNPYDRVHADPVFSSEIADQYLATYAEQALKGLADLVLVPDVSEVPVCAFLAFLYLTQDSKALHCQLARILLTATAFPCKGWNYKLVSEAVLQAKSTGVAYLLMTTQAANRAVIRNCEKLGFRLGGVTHIVSDYRQN